MSFKPWAAAMDKSNALPHESEAVAKLTALRTQIINQK